VKTNSKTSPHNGVGNWKEHNLNPCARNNRRASLAGGAFEGSSSEGSLKAPTIPSTRRKWVFRPKVGTEIETCPGVDRGTLRKRNPAARIPSFPQPGRADRNRNESKHFRPVNREAESRKARSSPGFTPILAKRKEKPESSSFTGSREGARKSGCTRRCFSCLARSRTGLLAASAVKSPRPARSNPKLLGAERSPDRPGE
jgi:hypothetical protein